MNDIRIWDDDDACCFYDFEYEFICLNYEEILRISNRLHISVKKLIPHVINHETLHHVLNKIINEKTCIALDNICENKISMEYWMW